MLEFIRFSFFYSGGFYREFDEVGVFGVDGEDAFGVDGADEGSEICAVDVS